MVLEKAPEAYRETLVVKAATAAGTTGTANEDIGGNPEVERLDYSISAMSDGYWRRDRPTRIIAGSTNMSYGVTCV